MIENEVDIRVNELKEKSYKIDLEWQRFIKEFKKNRVEEFNRLVDIKESKWEIPRKLNMEFNWRKWYLELRNVKAINYF